MHALRKSGEGKSGEGSFNAGWWARCRLGSVTINDAAFQGQELGGRCLKHSRLALFVSRNGALNS